MTCFRHPALLLRSPRKNATQHALTVATLFDVEILRVLARGHHRQPKHIRRDHVSHSRGCRKLWKVHLRKGVAVIFVIFVAGVLVALHRRLSDSARELRRQRWRVRVGKPALT
jgi:hypothetical protein